MVVIITITLPFCGVVLNNYNFAISWVWWAAGVFHEAIQAFPYKGNHCIDRWANPLLFLNSFTRHTILPISRDEAPLMRFDCSNMPRGALPWPFLDLINVEWIPCFLSDIRAMFKVVWDVSERCLLAWWTFLFHLQRPRQVAAVRTFPASSKVSLCNAPLWRSGRWVWNGSSTPSLLVEYRRRWKTS